MPPREQETIDGSMSLGDHLEELRWRIILALAVPLPLAIILFFVSSRLIELLLSPLYKVLAANNLPVQVQVLSPPEFLFIQLKLSAIFALIISGPWVVYQAWKFIAPGLYRHERRFVYLLMPGSAILTTIGMVLLYYVMLPLMLHVLVLFGSTMREPTMVLRPGDNAPAQTDAAMVIDLLQEPPTAPVPGQIWFQIPENMLHIAVPGKNDGELEVLRLYMGAATRVAQQFRLSEYTNFVLLMMLAMAIAFQLPLVILLLGWIGLVSADWLRKNRRYALGICAVIAAVITPADGASMIIMLIPLYALYELGIILLVFAPARAVADGTLLSRAPNEHNPYDRRNDA